MRFRSENEENFSFDLTPLVDVVFLLLIFFMVSTVFVDFKRQMDISLPSIKDILTNNQLIKGHLRLTKEDIQKLYLELEMKK